MREVRAEWPRWRRMSPALPDLALADLPAWMKDAEPSKRDGVLTALRAIADDDPRAYVLLSWLLMPGAACVAGRIRRLADAIDAIIAGQLWIQICEHDPRDDTYVARKILDRVYQGSRAELGVGEIAKRRDQTWARTVLVDALDDVVQDDGRGEWSRSAESLNDLLQGAIYSGRLSEGDRDLLLDLAHAAEHLAGARMCRTGVLSARRSPRQRSPDRRRRRAQSPPSGRATRPSPSISRPGEWRPSPWSRAPRPVGSGRRTSTRPRACGSTSSQPEWPRGRPEWPGDGRVG